MQPANIAGTNTRTSIKAVLEPRILAALSILANIKYPLKTPPSLSFCQCSQSIGLMPHFLQFSTKCPSYFVWFNKCRAPPRPLFKRVCHWLVRRWGKRSLMRANNATLQQNTPMSHAGLSHGLKLSSCSKQCTMYQTLYISMATDCMRDGHYLYSSSVPQTTNLTLTKAVDRIRCLTWYLFESLSRVSRTPFWICFQPRLRPGGTPHANTRFSPLARLTQHSCPLACVAIKFRCIHL